MKIQIIPTLEPTKQPCFMHNKFNQLFLVTKSLNEKKYYVTLLDPSDDNCFQTWESDLKDYTPVPAGNKIILIN